MNDLLRATAGTVLLLSLGTSVSSLSAEEQSKPRSAPIEDPEKKPPSSVTRLVYKPPLRGAPGKRFGGSSREITDAVTLAALVPDHTALTIQAQPVLYWFLPSVSDRPITFTLRDENPDPVIDRRLKPPSRPGVQQVRLTDFGVRLTPGKQYRWLVTVLLNPQHRTKGVFAGGTIEREQPSPALSTKLLQTDSAVRPSLYAEEGFWYDALEAISELMEVAPDDPALRAERASLLRQVGLSEVADYELQVSWSSK